MRVASAAVGTSEIIRIHEIEKIEGRLSELWGQIYQDLTGTLSEALALKAVSEGLAYQAGIAHSILLTARCLAGQDKYAEAVEHAAEAHQKP